MTPSSTTYIELPLETNGEALVEAAYALLEEQFPGWTPNAASGEVALIRAITFAIVLPLAELAVDVPAEIFARYGEEIVNLPPHLASAATVASTWKVVDTLGHTITAGTEVDIPTPDGGVQGFRVVTDVVVPAGSSETATGEVLLEAIEPGSAGDGIGEAGAVGNLVNALTWVEPEGIVLTGETTGGEDAEEPLAYLGRLAETMQTLSPRPVIARDVEIIARNITGVGRAMAIDNYDFPTENTEAEKTLTVFLTDTGGSPVSAPVKEAVLADLESKREANFVFYAEDPSYTEIDVKALGLSIRPGYDPATVKAAVAAAIRELVDPATWGQRRSNEPQTWINSTTLRYQDLVTAVNNVAGVDYYTTLEVRKHSGSYGTADIALTGPAALPKVNTVTVS